MQVHEIESNSAQLCKAIFKRIKNIEAGTYAKEKIK